MNGRYSLAYVSRNRIEGPPPIAHAKIAAILATARRRNGGDAGADAAGLRETADLLATDGGRHLLAVLQDLVSRDDLGRRREETKVR